MNEKSQILDGLLVLRAQQGDREAFEQLVRKWHKKLLYQSYIRTKDWEQSEDIIQDVWQWLVTNLRKLKEAAKFGSWIRTVVDRRSIDWIRKQQRTRNQFEKTAWSQESVEVLADPSDSVINKESRLSALESAMNELKPESKLILVLYYTEENSIESIAHILRVPKGTVKSRLFHAREKLKNMLKQDSYEKSE